MTDSGYPVLKFGERELLIDMSQEQIERVIQGARWKPEVLPEWIEKLKGLLLDATDQNWQVDETYQDCVSFQFTFRLGEFQCESKCWCMSRVADRFDSISEFLASVAAWPIQKWKLHVERLAESEQ